MTFLKNVEKQQGITAKKAPKSKKPDGAGEETEDPLKNPEPIEDGKALMNTLLEQSKAARGFALSLQARTNTTQMAKHAM